VGLGGSDDRWIKVNLGLIEFITFRSKIRENIKEKNREPSLLKQFFKT
jgi:hypothetical protein